MFPSSVDFETCHRHVDRTHIEERFLSTRAPVAATPLLDPSSTEALLRKSTTSVEASRSTPTPDFGRQLRHPAAAVEPAAAAARPAVVEAVAVGSVIRIRVTAGTAASISTKSSGERSTRERDRQTR